MALVLTERANSTTMIGETCISIGRTKRGEIKLIIDSPTENLVICSRNLKKALAAQGWTLEKNAFFATHEEHGRKHLRDLMPLLNKEDDDDDEEEDSSASDAG